MGTVANIKIEPMVVTWGTDTAQVQTVTTVADSSGSLNNKYFFFYEPDGTGHYVWYDVSSGGSDPALAGFTAHEVDITTDDTANSVASATQAVIDAIGEFGASVSTNVVTITNAANGYAQAAHDGDSGFSFAVTTEGNTAASVGFTDGDIEVNLGEDLVDVTGHEAGTNVLSQIRTGKQIEVTINFKETTKAQLLKYLRKAGGASFTPTGASGTEVTGYGTYKDFTQTLLQADKLVLHPKVLATADKSRDITFFKAYPQLDSIAFSGENILTVPATFKCYPDTSLNDRVEYFAMGDASQTLT